MRRHAAAGRGIAGRLFRRAAFCAATSVAQAADAAIVARIDAAPVIDGRLDDAVWSSLPVGRFTQAGPDTGRPCTACAPVVREAQLDR